MASVSHDVYLLARPINEWLPQGIQSLIEGTYTPRFLKRYYFKDEMLDQLYLVDRVLQNVLLQQLKPTFPHVMSPNCYHMHGSSGMQLATQKIRETLATEHYKSIQHHVLIEDIKRYYSDTKVQLMLEQIVRNPIETPRGYKNPDNGIALRGPLSQFFSALYLKPLDDAFDTLDVTYLRGNNNSIKPNQEYSEPITIAPHTRTIRKAREQVRLMVIDGFSIPRIRSYLTAWSRRWVRSSQVWSHQTLLIQFIRSCYDPKITGIGAETLLINLRRMEQPVSEGLNQNKRCGVLPHFGCRSALLGL